MAGGINPHSMAVPEEVDVLLIAVPPIACLTGDFFQTVHAWLPFTWVVKAFRASLFGAFDNGWLQAWAAVCWIGVAALLASIFLGRWRLVGAEEFRPGVEA